MTPIEYKIDIQNKTLTQKSKLLNRDGYLQGSNKLIDNEYKIQEMVFDRFLNEIKSIKMDSSIRHLRDGLLHGTGLRFSTIDQWNDSISLITVNPIRTEKYLLDYKILDAFFDLAQSTIKDYRGLSLTENIQNRFDYGLPIKEISQKPLEYRLKGSISGCRDSNQSLVDLLESLPNNTPILFDVRNGRFAPCLNELLEEYGTKKNIYFYGNYHLNQMDLDIEVLKEQLPEAEKDNSRGQVGSIRMSLKGLLKEREKEIEIINNSQNIYQTREEVLKTIANNAYNSALPYSYPENY